MTKRELGLLIVRLLALYLLVTSSGLLIYIMSILERPGNSKVSLWVILALNSAPVCAQVLFSFLLWVGAPTITHFLIVEFAENEPVSSWQPREIAQIGIILIGLFCLLHSLLAVGYFASSYGLALGFGGTGTFMRSAWAGLLIGVPPAVCGLVLIGCARLLSYWLSPRREKRLRDEFNQQEQT